jgi:hypothetical protein
MTRFVCSWFLSAFSGRSRTCGQMGRSPGFLTHSENSYLDAAGTSTPTVFQGRVYGGTAAKVYVLGLCSSSTGGCITNP